MVYEHKNHAYGYILGKAMYSLAGGLATVFGIFVTLPSASWPAYIKVHHSFFVVNAYKFFLVISVFLLIGAVLLIRGDKRYNNLLKYTVNRYQDILFDYQGPHYENRITLFKSEKCRFKSIFKYKKASGNWSFSNKSWLCPVIRSHSDVPKRVMFSIPSNLNEVIESIAARAWSTRKASFALNLPYIEKSSKDNNLEKYAIKSSTTINFVKRYISDKKTLPRSIAAMPIEANGKLWGVLVVDTIKASRLDESCFDSHPTAIALINKLVEDSRF